MHGFGVRVIVYICFMAYKMGPGKARLDIAIDKEVVRLCRRLHRAYNHRTGLNVSYARFIESMLMSYLNSQSGKELLQYAIRHDIQEK